MAKQPPTYLSNQLSKQPNNDSQTVAKQRNIKITEHTHKHEIANMTKRLSNYATK